MRFSRTSILASKKGIKLNTAQRKILKIAASIAIIPLLFPPFVFNHFQGGAIAMTYGFLLSPPQSIIFSDKFTGVVDTPLLLIEYLVIAVIAGIAWVLYGQQSK
jgi:hypothetical protein